MAFALPKIVYPTQPASPNTPSLASTPAGALGATTYYVKVTYITPWGESLAAPEAALSVPANYVLQVGPVAAPAPPTIALGWNVYVSTSSNAETQQNATPIALGAIWTEPTSGLVAGSAYPTTWGATLSFTRQPRNIPYDVIKATRHDSFSTAGWRQAITERLENYLTLDVENINIGADVVAWDNFLQQATQGIPFDYFVDGTQPTYTTYSLVEMDRPLAYKSMGLYSVSLTFRKEMQQTSPPIGVSIPPVNSIKWVPFFTLAPGNFSLAHNLGYTPLYVGVPMVFTFLGTIVFQPTIADQTNLYLVASDASLRGIVGVC